MKNLTGVLMRTMSNTSAPKKSKRNSISSQPRYSGVERIWVKKMKVVELRRASTKSLAEINALLPQLSKTAKPISLRAFQAIVKNKDICLIVSKDRERIMGMGTLVIMHTVVGVRARIEDVVVDERYRGKGIGEKISKKLIILAKGKRVESIELSSRPNRVAANKLYKKLGFKKRDTNVYNLPLQ